MFYTYDLSKSKATLSCYARYCHCLTKTQASSLHSWTTTSVSLAQSNLSCVNFQGNGEIGSHKTGGHLIEV